MNVGGCCVPNLNSPPMQKLWRSEPTWALIINSVFPYLVSSPIVLKSPIISNLYATQRDMRGFLQWPCSTKDLNDLNHHFSSPHSTGHLGGRGELNNFSTKGNLESLPTSSPLPWPWDASGPWGLAGSNTPPPRTVRKWSQGGCVNSQKMPVYRGRMPGRSNIA